MLGTIPLGERRARTVQSHDPARRSLVLYRPLGDRRSLIHEREPFRVGIIADTVDYPGGIGRYVREVLGALGRRADVTVTALTTESGSAAVRRIVGANLQTLLVAPRSNQVSLALWARYRSGPAFARARAEIVIGTKHLVPRTDLTTLLVVHDVLTITRAHENARVKRILLPRQYRRSLDAATHLVAVSAATRSRLGDLDARWMTKCSVVPNGMSARLIEVDPVAPVEIANQRFALVVGDLSPRKNLALLTRLWASESPAGLTLVVIGPDSGTDEPVRAELLALEQAGRVVWIRGAEDPILRWCYEHAAVVLFPTFEEGFGLPLLEALTFHAPVVASTDRALREVAAGDARVTHLDPEADRDWHHAIERVAAEARSSEPPRLPPGAITWDEHTDRLLADARLAVRPA